MSTQSLMNWAARIDGQMASDRLKEREAVKAWAKKNGYGNSMLRTHAQIGWDAAIAYHAQQPSQPADCGEAGHAEGRCGNLNCMPSRAAQPVAPILSEKLIREVAAKYSLPYSTISFVRELELHAAGLALGAVMGGMCKPEPLALDEYTAIASRFASRYGHRSDPTHCAYTFLPHTLGPFVRALETLIHSKRATQ